MTTIPLTILDDFFPNPDVVRKWALSLDYFLQPEGKWPGKRTEFLHKINPNFYNYVNQKVLSLFFENVNILQYSTALVFQLIEDYEGSGWIHQDPDVFTYIIYLSDSTSELNCGTSIWDLNKNKVCPIENQQEKEIDDLRFTHHKNKTIPPEIENSKNNQFTPSLSVPDKFNRLLCFPSEVFHSANILSPPGGSRLTLIGFVRNISTAKLPVIRSKQTLMF